MDFYFYMHSLLYFCKSADSLCTFGLKTNSMDFSFTFFLHILTNKEGKYYSSLVGFRYMKRIRARNIHFYTILRYYFNDDIINVNTTPIEITDGLETLLKPLKRIKVPVHEIALMMSISLRFIPTLMDETSKIMKAQSSRGIDFAGDR